MAGKLTIQHWQEQQEREAERTRVREEALAELSREIASLVVMCSRRRRKPSLLTRFIRTFAIPF